MRTTHVGTRLRAAGGTTATVLLLVCALSASAFASVLPSDGDPPTAGQQVTLPFWSEPEFNLFSGENRWNIKNRPDGTISAAYGHPSDAIHDDYMATARYPSLGADPTRTPIDVAVLPPSSYTGRVGSWNVVRYDDQTMQVWGPVDAPNPQAFDLRLIVEGEVRDIVGGTLLNDMLSGGARVPNRAIVVDANGLLYRVDVDTGEGELLDDVGKSFFGEETNALAGVARAWTDTGRPAVNPGRTTDGNVVVSDDPGSEVLMVLLDNGHLVPVSVGPIGATIRPPLSAFDADLFVDPAAIPVQPVFVDFDFDCTSTGMTRASGELYQGDVSLLLQCRESYFDTNVSTGRLSVAVGETQPDYPIFVDVLTVSDTLEGDDGSVRHGREVRHDQACRFFEKITPGSFDVRVVHDVTHVACAGFTPEIPGVQDRAYIIDTYHQPRDYSPVIGEDPDGRDPVYGVQGTPIERRTFDRLHQPGPGDVSTGPPIIEETYEDLESLTIAIQFPCETLLPRPTGLTEFGSPVSIEQCAGIEEEFAGGAVADTAPNWVSLTVAGYGRVGSERRLFVNTQPHRNLLRQELDARELPWSEEIEQQQFTWTIEPSDFLSTDLEKLREDFEGADSAAFDVFDAEGAPPLFLTHVPRGSRTEMTVKFLSGTPTTRTVPVAPVAVLQAPPTVGGLGQQTTFTPEFAQTSSSGTSTTKSMSTHLGTHMGIEASVTAGSGAAGNSIRGGVGVAVDYQFMNEVENSETEAVTVETTEGYGGSFADHTVVMRSVVQDVWRAQVVSDETGLAVGDVFDHAISRGVIDQSVLLSQLEVEQPGLFGESGVFRPSLDRILAGESDLGDPIPIEIGNPGSYLPGADDEEPESILSTSGGPCNGGFGAPDDPTPGFGSLPSSVSPANPYYGTSPPTPMGPNVLTSATHAVSVGNDLTEGATISILNETAQSLLTSYSSTFSLTGILKFESEVSLGVSTKVELQASAGVDAGFGNGAEVESTLGTGSGLSTVLGNVPHVPDAGSEWLEGEGYRWKMFMCRAPIGPAGLGMQAWVQGYVVDGYGGSGGIEDLADVDAEAPVASAVAFADPTIEPTGATGPCDTVGERDNRFAWAHYAGTVDRYAVVLENITGGGVDERVLADLAQPADFDPSNDRFGCAGISAGDFVDGDLYRWRAVIDGFVDNSVQSEWEFFRPQVWPPDQTITLRTPIRHADDSVTIDIDDPAGVRSLRHDVTVLAVDGDERTEVASRQGIRSNSYRTPTLEPGAYVAEVVGHNDHVLGGGGRAETSMVEVEFVVEERLAAQFVRGDCVEDPCTTADAIEFTDESVPAGGVPIVGWNWSFGDGTTSTDQHPTHRFVDLPADGTDTFDVYLTVTDAIGRTDGHTQQVTLQSAAPEIDASGLEHETVVGEPLTMTVDVTDPDNVGRDPGAQQIPEVEWDLDDDGVADVTQSTSTPSVTHTFDAPGGHPVTVTATDPHGRTTSHDFVVTVAPAPATQFVDVIGGWDARIAAGDLDGDGADDLLGHRPGAASDGIAWNGSSPAFDDLAVGGDYTPVVGDFDGDGGDDVLWYAPGGAADFVWWSDGDRSFTSRPTSINGTYTPVAGDFDGDGGDDVLWYAPGG
ncbi:MAG: PKD domain-containing protein, partial [Acidimicrobiales bacterium]|nr:PKD domain-containing protein [Acidimicrobiales bacterium]